LIITTYMMLVYLANRRLSESNRPQDLSLLPGDGLIS